MREVYKLWQNSYKLVHQQASPAFNGHFPGGPGLAGTRMFPFWSLLELRMMEVVVTTGTIRCAKPQSNHHHQQTNIQFVLQAGCPSCHPTNSVEALKGKNITFHGLAYPKLTWGLPTLSLTTNSSWLPWGRVAMPLISPLMPVRHERQASVIANHKLQI